MGINLKLMLLLSGSDLHKLLLRDAIQESLHTHEHFVRILLIQNLPLRSPNKALDLHHAVLVQMRAHAILNLLKYSLQESLRIVIAPASRLDNLVHVPRRNQVLNRNPLAHNQRFVRLGNTQPLDERAARAALGHETQGRERGEQEGVRGRVDEVSERSEGGGETDGGPVHGDDEDLGVRVEGVREVEVVDHEALCDLTAGVVAAGIGTGHLNVSAAVVASRVSCCSL